MAEKSIGALVVLEGESRRHITDAITQEIVSLGAVIERNGRARHYDDVG